MTNEQLTPVAVEAPPVIVFQMGKVASSSIYQSIKNLGGFEVHHVHRMHPDSINTMTKVMQSKGLAALKVDIDGLRLYRQYIRQSQAIKVITLVREPISRNMSAYFQNLEEYEGDKKIFSKLELSELIRAFLSKYQHKVPLRWFDKEFKAALGVDVYAYPFDKQLGYQRIQEGATDILIFKHDLDDQVKEQVIRDFLESPDFVLTNANEGDNKIYGEVYKAFRESIVFPCSYIDEMLSAKYTKHFYTDEEIAAIRSKWRCE